MGRAILVAVVAFLGAAPGTASQPAASAARAPVILYASDQTGSTQIFEINAFGRPQTRQVTFGHGATCGGHGPCGWFNPIPSPDGRRVLYSSGYGGELWIARADGTRPHVLASGTVNAEVAWTRDSQHIAYAGQDGIHTVSAQGQHDRLIASCLCSDPTWSPDGRAVAFVRREEGAANGTLVIRHGAAEHSVATDVGAARPFFINAASFRPLVAWSPDGRWLAYQHGDKLDVVHPNGTGRRAIAQGAAFAWSPDGGRLAFAERGGIAIANLATGRVAVLRRGISAGLVSWSPDGRSIAYVDIAVQDLGVLSLAGHNRALVRGGVPYRGQLFGLAWARRPAGVAYRRPEPASLQTVSPTELVARAPVTRLAADGPRVAYSVCERVFVWTPGTGAVVPVDPLGGGLCSELPDLTQSVYDLAIAGERVAYGVGSGGISEYWSLLGETIGAQHSSLLANGEGCCAGPALDRIGDLAGSGNLLVYGSQDEGCAPAPDGCLDLTTTAQRVLRVDSDCPCRVIASSPGPLVPFDVDTGRLVVGGDNAVLLLDRDGAQLLSVPFHAAAGALTGNDLALLARGELRDYDATTGALRHVWQLPDVPSGASCRIYSPHCPTPALRLEDAAHGLAAYVVDDNVHVLRLADGVDTTVAHGSIARFMQGGLVAVDGAHIHLIPFERLP